MFTITLAIIGFIIGVAIIAYSSNIAVKHSATLAAQLGISNLVIGVTLVAIGTDISEIFNSIISCALGHGDIDVGDSVGSDLTQLTLVFGLLPFICGTFKVRRREFLILGACEILSLIVIYAIVQKGYITRLDAIFMVGSLGLYLFIIYQVTKDTIIERVDLVITKTDKSKKYHAIIATLGFLGVAFSSYMIVLSVITLSLELGVHEFVISFIFLSLATSLPELAVDITALRKKHYNMAIGDIIGSCIVDSTLSIGIGQVFFPQAVSADLAIPAILYTMFASFIVIVIVSSRQKVDKKAGAIFIALYAISFIVLFSVWATLY
ncbi:MAG: sodium:calcium antiporter [Candidatus Hodarchaeota archaeon]